MTVVAVVAALWFFTERDAPTTNAPGTAAAPGMRLSPSDATARRYAGDLRRGNVVILADPRELVAARALARDVAGPAEPSVREAGQAVLVRPGVPQMGPPRVTAYAEGRGIIVERASDPALRAFVEYWLGRAAG